MNIEYSCLICKRKIEFILLNHDSTWNVFCACHVSYNAYRRDVRRVGADSKETLDAFITITQTRTVAAQTIKIG